MKKDRIYLISLLIISSLIAFYRLIIQIEVGPRWDTCAYLLNAFTYAEMEIGYFEDIRPPLISWIISLFFRLGATSDVTIFSVSAIFYVLGAVGLFSLLKLRFPPSMSFLGAILFIGYPVVMNWACVGYVDVESVTLAIYTIYFGILAIEKGKYFYILAIPFYALSFLMKYTSVLIIVPIFLYWFVRGDIADFKNKYFVLGAIISIIPVVIWLMYNLFRFGSPLHSFQRAATFMFISPIHPFYGDIWYYFYNFPEYLGPKPLNIVFLLLMIVGICSIFIKFFEKEDWDTLDLLFLTWFLVMFTFFSYINLKDARYFIQMAPSVTYLILTGCEKVLSYSKRYRKEALIPPLFGVIVFLLMAFSLNYVTTHPTGTSPYILETVEWYNIYGEENAIIAANSWPYFSWYFKRGVVPVPHITNKTHIVSILEKNRADYFFSIRKLNLSNYYPIQQFGRFYVYKKKEKNT